ncbi:MAG: class I SAM-dependent methyltransferase [Chloroflexota bacterium]|nr:class I SAM-dependent methyltransferase [Chloroflexota bacterium]
MAEIVTKQDQWQKLYGYILGNQAAWVADVGLKAGLFAAIASAGPNGIGEDALASALGYDARYTRVWCRAAYAFELLDWDEATGYRLAPHMDTLLLDPADPRFCGGRIQFFTALHEDFRAFPDSLRTGRVWPRREHDPWLLEALKNLTKPDAVMLTDHVLPQSPALVARLEAGGTILEIGPGGGYALVHLAHRFPNARVIGLESDAPSIGLARRTVADAGLAGRVEIRHGDANELVEEETYDLVVMNIVLHETGGPAEYHNVLRRTHRALEPGGSVLVSELPYPDSPTAYRGNPVYQMLAGVQIHEAQVGCGAITQGELRRLLDGAGFVNTRVIDQPIPARFVMMGEK